MLLWGEDDPEGRFDPRLPHHVGHRMYQQGRIRFFIDPTTWIDHLGTRDFVFGTRIHGNVAALMAGTPAVGLPWDSRTTELCEYHSIPHRRATREVMAVADAAELYDEADFGPFNAGRARRRAELVAFLGRNGLVAAEEFGEVAEASDARLARVGFAPPVTPPVATPRARWKSCVGFSGCAKARAVTPCEPACFRAQRPHQRRQPRPCRSVWRVWRRCAGPSRRHDNAGRRAHHLDDDGVQVGARAGRRAAQTCGCGASATLGALTSTVALADHDGPPAAWPA